MWKIVHILIALGGDGFGIFCFLLLKCHCYLFEVVECREDDLVTSAN